MDDGFAIVDGLACEEKQRRLRLLYANRHRSPKHAAKWSRAFSDSSWIDPGCIVTDCGRSTLEQVTDLLLADLPPQVEMSIISEDAAFDGVRGEPGSCLRTVFGQGQGSLLYTLDHPIAYYEGEGPSDRLLLAPRTAWPVAG